ncbi:MAG: hypothetical protein M3Z13_06985 [Candidatus Dormibacteraeota bacterium]|nr:hypothetical protein [Candidatus Dormibacteraeota bacterium]
MPDMDQLSIFLPLASMAVTALFALLVFDQWRHRRRSFQLVWGIGLLFYSVGAGSEFAGALFGWTPALYKVWYLGGALLTAAFLGMGTIYLLRRSRFGYFAAVAIFAGGMIALAAGRSYPGSQGTALGVFVAATAAAVAVVFATARHRTLAADLTMILLVLASLAAAVAVLAAPVPSPGYVLSATTHAPVGSGFPGSVRVLTPAFNVAGALCLVFGAIFSAYVYMPKRKLLRAWKLPPVVAQLYGAAAVLVNFSSSLPAAGAALARGELNSRVPATILIAAGGFVPSITSGLNRFGITWAFFLGELLGALLILAGFLVSEDVLAAAGTREDRRSRLSRPA